MAFKFPALLGITPGMRVLVAGGTGTVGSGVSIALLKQGAKVTVITRNKKKFQQVFDHFNVPCQVKENLDAVEGDVSTELGVRHVLKESTGGIQEPIHVVSSVGSMWRKGSLTKQSLKEFNAVVQEQITSNFLLFKYFAPFLDQYSGSTYTWITGSRFSLPADASLMLMSQEAVVGLAGAARHEFHNSKVAVSEFNIKCAVLPANDDSLYFTDPFSLGHDLVGTSVAATISNRMRGKTVLSYRQQAHQLVSTANDYKHGTALENQQYQQR